MTTVTIVIIIIHWTISLFSKVVVPVVAARQTWFDLIHKMNMHEKNERWSARKRHGKRAKDQRAKSTDSSPLTYSVSVHKIHFLSSFCNYIFFIFCFAFLTLTLWFPLSSLLQMMSPYISFSNYSLTLSILIEIPFFLALCAQALS